MEIEINWRGIKISNVKPKDATICYDIRPKDFRREYFKAVSTQEAIPITFENVRDSEIARMPSKLKKQMLEFAHKNECENVFLWVARSLKDYLKFENIVSSDVKIEIHKEENCIGILYYTVVETDGTKSLFTAFDKY